ncbi:hypothetical protein Tco_0622007 [Tanacetum coccineum]
MTFYEFFRKLNVFKIFVLDSVPEPFSFSEDLNIKSPNLCSGSETEEGLCKELQSSLVDNSKLNVVYLLNRRLKCLFHFFKVYKDFQDSPDDEEDTRSSHEYLNDLEEEYQERTLLAKSKRNLFKIQRILSLKAYEWDEEGIDTSNDNEMVEVKVLMALAEENDANSKKGAKNGEWVKICMRKVHTLLEMEINREEKSKPKSTLDDSIVFDDQDVDHGMEYIETEEAMDEGRQSSETEEVKLTDDTEVVEDKGSGDKGGNAKELVSTARPEVSTARPYIDVAWQEDSVVEPRTPPTTTSIFDDKDITMAQTLIKMKEEKAKEKGVSIKDVDDSSRPTRSILTLKPLPTIDPKDKGKGVLKESPVKKVKRSDLDAAQIAKDAEIARLVELAEMEREREERQRQDQASVDYIASLYDEVQAKMDASEELAARLQMEEREMYTIEERSKLLAEFFERRKKLLAKERVDVVRNKPLTRTQLRSLMMTYLKHTDEKMIDKMNKKAAGMDKEEVPEESKSTKVEVKQEGREENIRKRSGRRLKMKATKKSKRQKTDSDLEEEEQLRASLKIVPDEEEEIDYEVLGTRVHILALEDGTKIHMLAERRYPLIRETLERMIELRLTVESEGEAVLDLLRFIQKQIDEFGGQDGSEKDL